MKVLQIVPRDGRKFYDSVVRKQDDIRRNGRGTFSRSGRKRRNAAHWVHAKFTGSVDLARAENLVTAKIKSRNKADESKLCTAFPMGRSPFRRRPGVGDDPVSLIMAARTRTGCAPR